MTLAEKIIILFIVFTFLLIAYRWGKAIVVWGYTIYDIVKNATGSWKIGIGALLIIILMIYQIFR